MLEDVSTLFRDTGIDRHVQVTTNEHSYEVQQASSDNWLYAAFIAFQRLRRCLNREVESFATIGTGPGLDAIGAWHVFHPQFTVMTDVHPEVLPLAARNFTENTSAEVLALHGSLLQPLRREGLSMDLIYANLPNLPSLEPVGAGQASASFYPAGMLHASGETEAYCLAMQVAAIQGAGAVLNGGGSLLLNFGARVPLHLLRQEVERNDLIYQELFSGVKRQTQAGEVLPGYAAAEQKHGVQFDFYSFENSGVPDDVGDFAGGTDSLKDLLTSFRVSATEALALHKQGKSVHHAVQVIRAMKK